MNRITPHKKKLRIENDHIKKELRIEKKLQIENYHIKGTTN